VDLNQSAIATYEANHGGAIDVGLMGGTRGAGGLGWGAGPLDLNQSAIATYEANHGGAIGVRILWGEA
jgi:hypothetical protein